MISGAANKRMSGGRHVSQDKLSSLDLETLIALKDVYGRKMRRLIAQQIKTRTSKVSA
jgi:hypothetical protein